MTARSSASPACRGRRSRRHFTPAVEVGWRLARDAWGHGYATEARSAALDFGFETVGLDEIVSFTVPANVALAAVMERIGMTHDPADDFDHPRLPVGHPLRRARPVPALARAETAAASDVLRATVRRRRARRAAAARSRTPRAGSRAPARRRPAARREGPVDRPADEHAARAEGQRDRDVEAAPDAAVDPDLEPAGDRLDDLLEHVDRGGRRDRAGGAPWFETTIASTPCSTASRASSAVRMPLSTSGSD